MLRAKIFAGLSLLLLSCGEEPERRLSDFEVRVLGLQRDQAYLHWSVPYLDGTPLEYSVFLEGKFIESTTGTYYLLGGLTPYTAYDGEINASDGRGHSVAVPFSFTTDSIVTVFKGDIWLKNQNDVLKFAKAEYKVVDGDLRIGGYCGGGSGI